MTTLEKQTGAMHPMPQTGNGFSPSSHPNLGPDGRSLHLRPIANPAPLGLLAFASTTIVLSFINVNARHVTEPNAVLSIALGYGGLAQLLAGMWEFVCGNTFGATAFSSYGAFWISYALLLLPGTGIGDAYANGQDLKNAIGFFLMSFFIVTFIFFLASLRSTLALAALFGFLDLTFLLLMIAEFTDSLKIQKAGGAFGILTAAIAYYAGASGLVTNQASYVTLPVGDLPKYNPV